MQLRHLEWEARRRGQRIGEDYTGVGDRLGQQLILQIGSQAGLFAEGKCRAYLHARGALIECKTQTLRVAIAPGQPEGNAQRA